MMFPAAHTEDQKTKSSFSEPQTQDIRPRSRFQPRRHLTSPVWRCRPLVRAATSGSGGCWLVFTEAEGTASALARPLIEEMEAAGRSVFEVRVGDAFQHLGETLYTVRRRSQEDLAAMLNDLPELLGGVVWLRSLNAGSSKIQDRTGQTQADELLHTTLVLSNHLDAPLERFAVVTAGLSLGKTESAVGEEVANDGTAPLRAAATWGLGRLLRSERPQLSPLLVDVDPRQPASETISAALASEILARSREDEVALRADSMVRGDSHLESPVQRFVYRLVPGIRGVPATTAVRNPGVHANATYLITGDLAGTGADLALWLRDQGARRLVLIARGDLTRAAGLAVAALHLSGVRVDLHHADLADPREVEEMIEEIDRPEAPLKGIFHTARSYDSGRLEENNSDRLERMMARRARGAWHLHEAASRCDLDYFVVLSSFGAMVGEPGQCTAAVADCFLDGLVMLRRQQGLPGLNVCLGPIGGLRLRRSLDSELAARGHGVLPVEEAFRLMTEALRHGAAQIFAARIDWRRWLLRSSAPWAPRYEELGAREPDLLPLRPINRGPGRPMIDLRHCFMPVYD